MLFRSRIERSPIARVPFISRSRRIRDYQDSGETLKKTTTIRKFITTGAWKYMAYLHHITCETAQRKTVKEIVLPDNMFIHIFAITLEK